MAVKFSKFYALLMSIPLGWNIAWADSSLNWELAKDEQGIQVYLATVSGSKYKAYKGVTTIKSGLSALLLMQENADEFCQWLYSCLAHQVLKTDGRISWTYTQFTAPWPVSKRDSVLKVTSTYQEDGSLVRMTQSLPDFIPEKKGFVRVAKVDGFWQFKPVEEDTVEVTYQVHTEPGGSVSAVLANTFVVDAPFNTLKTMKELAEK